MTYKQPKKSCVIDSSINVSLIRRMNLFSALVILPLLCLFFSLSACNNSRVGNNGGNIDPTKLSSIKYETPDGSNIDASINGVSKMVNIYFKIDPSSEMTSDIKDFTVRIVDSSGSSDQLSSSWSIIEPASSTNTVVCSKVDTMNACHIALSYQPKKEENSTLKIYYMSKISDGNTKYDQEQAASFVINYKSHQSNNLVTNISEQTQFDVSYGDEISIPVIFNADNGTITDVNLKESLDKLPEDWSYTGETACSRVDSTSAACKVMLKFKPSAKDTNEKSLTIKVNYKDADAKSRDKTILIKYKSSGNNVLKVEPYPIELIAYVTKSEGDKVRVVKEGKSIVKFSLNKTIADAKITNFVLDLKSIADSNVWVYDKDKITDKQLSCQVIDQAATCSIDFAFRPVSTNNPSLNLNYVYQLNNTTNKVNGHITLEPKIRIDEISYTQDKKEFFYGQVSKYTITMSSGSKLFKLTKKIDEKHDKFTILSNDACLAFNGSCNIVVTVQQGTKAEEINQNIIAEYDGANGVRYTTQVPVSYKLLDSIADISINGLDNIKDFSLNNQHTTLQIKSLAGSADKVDLVTPQDDNLVIKNQKDVVKTISCTKQQVIDNICIFYLSSKATQSTKDKQFIDMKLYKGADLKAEIKNILSYNHDVFPIKFTTVKDLNVKFLHDRDDSREITIGEIDRLYVKSGTAKIGFTYMMTDAEKIEGCGFAAQGGTQYIKEIDLSKSQTIPVTLQYKMCTIAPFDQKANNPKIKLIYDGKTVEYNVPYTYANKPYFEYMDDGSDKSNSISGFKYGGEARSYSGNIRITFSAKELLNADDFQYLMNRISLIPSPDPQLLADGIKDNSLAATVEECAPNQKKPYYNCAVHLTYNGRNNFVVNKDKKANFTFNASFKIKSQSSPYPVVKIQTKDQQDTLTAVNNQFSYKWILKDLKLKAHEQKITNLQFYNRTDGGKNNFYVGYLLKKDSGKYSYNTINIIDGTQGEDSLTDIGRHIYINPTNSLKKYYYTFNGGELIQSYGAATKIKEGMTLYRDNSAILYSQDSSNGMLYFVSSNGKISNLYINNQITNINEGDGTSGVGYISGRAAHDNKFAIYGAGNYLLCLSGDGTNYKKTDITNFFAKNNPFGNANNSSYLKYINTGVILSVSSYGVFAINDQCQDIRKIDYVIPNSDGVLGMGYFTFLDTKLFDGIGWYVKAADNKISTYLMTTNNQNGILKSQISSIEDTFDHPQIINYEGNDTIYPLQIGEDQETGAKYLGMINKNANNKYQILLYQLTGQLKKNN